MIRLLYILCGVFFGGLIVPAACQLYLFYGGTREGIASTAAWLALGTLLCAGLGAKAAVHFADYCGLIPDDRADPPTSES